MPRALKTCARPGCPNLVPSGRCDGCAKQGDRERGTSWQRGYRTAHRNGFRPAVLLRDPICKCDAQRQHKHGAECYRASTVADHWPLSRRELVERGMDPNDPKHGRGLCAQCHGSETTVHQPGGWNAR